MSLCRTLFLNWENNIEKRNSAAYFFTQFTTQTDWLTWIDWGEVWYIKRERVSEGKILWNKIKLFKYCVCWKNAGDMRYVRSSFSAERLRPAYAAAAKIRIWRLERKIKCLEHLDLCFIFYSVRARSKQSYLNSMKKNISVGKIHFKTFKTKYFEFMDQLNSINNYTTLLL